MPLYNYYCKICDNCFDKIVNYKNRKDVKCIKCGSDAIIKPPLSQPVIVKELVDTFKNKAITKDINKIMKKREIQHTIDHNLGELIEKHGLKTIKKTNFWKYKKGKII